MSWLTAVLLGHFFNAISYVLDKVLLTKTIKNPFSFTFYVGALGLLSLVLIPFGFEIPGAGHLILNLIGGALFSLALLFFFLALQKKEASRIVPFVGGAVPVFTLIFELLFLEDRLNYAQLTGFLVLVLGTVMIAWEGKKSEAKFGYFHGGWLWGILAAVLFAISFGMTKIAFTSQLFFSAFVWMRIGGFMLPLFFLFSARQRLAIKEAATIFKERSGLLYLLAQGFGALGFIFINYAITKAAVSIVNALQGVQYAFLLIIAVIASVKYPKLLKENMTRRSLIMKLIAVGVISLGLFLVV